eukprot:scaffold466183_cov17-Prasinocladus_malaysianus.AAC.1
MASGQSGDDAAEGPALLSLWVGGRGCRRANSAIVYKTPIISRRCLVKYADYTRHSEAKVSICASVIQNINCSDVK